VHIVKVRLHAVERVSRANGPGLRAVVWFQGCTLGCSGCFNAATHDPAGGYESDTATLATELLANRNGIDGISFSGGEPFQQAEAFLDLLRRLCGSGLGFLAFSGYTLDEIECQPLGSAILKHLDVLVAGRFVASLIEGWGLRGSSNQRVHLLTSRYTPRMIGATPRTEIILHTNGCITCSGIAPWRGSSQVPL